MSKEENKKKSDTQKEVSYKKKMQDKVVKAKSDSKKMIFFKTTESDEKK